MSWDGTIITSLWRRCWRFGSSSPSWRRFENHLSGTPQSSRAKSLSTRSSIPQKQEEEGKAFATLSSWLWKRGREYPPTHPKTLDKMNLMMRQEPNFSDQILRRWRLATLLHTFQYSSKSFIRSLAKMNLMMRQEPNFPDGVLASFNYRN